MFDASKLQGRSKEKKKLKSLFASISWLKPDIVKTTKKHIIKRKIKLLKYITQFCSNFYKSELMKTVILDCGLIWY